MSDRTWSPFDARGPAAAMPWRVRRAILKQQVESERLIGWIQLVVVAGFVALYVIAPQTAPEVGTYNPVPWILLAYLLFACARLTVAYLGWLPRWFLMLSAVSDMALVMMLIWSFHLQYEQPAAIYLKAPTWAYVFVFIAVRALRFDPRYVLTAGMAAVAGWGALVAYAVLADPGARVTHDYVEYVTSPSVLVRAELDKLMTIVVVTLILALALRRGRDLLVRAALESEAAKDLARFFAPAIARRITSAEHPLRPGQGEVRRVAVLQVDLKRFTRFAAHLAPDQTIAVLTEYQARVVPIIRRHGGNVEKFLGDGIMATFGAAEAGGSYAADALRAVLEIVGAMRLWTGFSHVRQAEPAVEAYFQALASSPGRARGLTAPEREAGLAVSIAVAHGDVVVGAVGDTDRLEYTVIGNPVNVAAKLEKHTRAEGVTAVATADLWRLARAQGFTGAPDAVLRRSRIAGLSEPVEFVILAG